MLSDSCEHLEETFMDHNRRLGNFHQNALGFASYVWLTLVCDMFRKF